MGGVGSTCLCMCQDICDVGVVWVVLACVRRYVIQVVPVIVYV